jgi:hypothetical protein
MDWIHLALNEKRWRILMIMVINIRLEIVWQVELPNWHCYLSHFVKKAKAARLHIVEAQGKEVQLLLIHDLGTRRGEWSASRPGHTLPPGKGPPVHLGWVGSRDGLDTEAKGKMFLRMPRIEPLSPGRLICSQTGRASPSYLVNSEFSNFKELRDVSASEELLQSGNWKPCWSQHKGSKY